MKPLTITDPFGSEVRTSAIPVDEHWTMGGPALAVNTASTFEVPTDGVLLAPRDAIRFGWHLLTWGIREALRGGPRAS